jgi:hypothetical protein
MKIIPDDYTPLEHGVKRRDFESLNQLRESPDYELCRLSEKKPGVLDELAAEREKLLEKEISELSGAQSSGIR